MTISVIIGYILLIVIVLILLAYMVFQIYTKGLMGLAFVFFILSLSVFGFCIQIIAVGGTFSLTEWIVIITLFVLFLGMAIFIWWRT